MSVLGKVNISPASGPDPDRFRQYLHVAVHDIAPCYRNQLEIIKQQLQPLLGSRFSGAIVTCWRGQPITECRWLCDGFLQQIEEPLLHGFSHYNSGGFGLTALLTSRSDEFSQLSMTAAEQRIASARKLLSEVISKPVLGFVPPAWQKGPVTMAMLAKLGLRYCVGMHGVDFHNSSRIPLVTWSWDCGSVAALAYAGELYGLLTATFRHTALPTVVIHPLDVNRGFLPRALRRIKSLLDKGCQPVLLADFLTTKTA